MAGGCEITHIYLVHDNKGTLYGIFTSLEQAKKVKARIEKKIHEDDELKDIELEIVERD